MEWCGGALVQLAFKGTPLMPLLAHPMMMLESQSQVQLIKTITSVCKHGLNH